MAPTMFTTLTTLIVLASCAIPAPEIVASRTIAEQNVSKNTDVEDTMVPTVKLIHDITQLNYLVEFGDDFEGMVRITFLEVYPAEGRKGYVRHEHIGCPGWSMEKLEKAVNRCLENFYDEIIEDRIEKDGLAD